MTTAQTFFNATKELKLALKDIQAEEMITVVDHLIYYIDQTAAVDGRLSVRGFVRSLQKEEDL